MKNILATFGICVALAAAGCAQKADTTTTLGAFDDNAKTCCPATGGASGCPMAAKAQGTACCKSKANKTANAACCSSSKKTTEAN